MSFFFELVKVLKKYFYRFQLERLLLKFQQKMHNLTDFHVSRSFILLWVQQTWHACPICHQVWLKKRKRNEQRENSTTENEFDSIFGQLWPAFSRCICVFVFFRSNAFAGAFFGVRFQFIGDIIRILQRAGKVREWERERDRGTVGELMFSTRRLWVKCALS